MRPAIHQQKTQFQTIGHALMHYASCQPEKDAYSFVRFNRKNQASELILSFGQAAKQATSLALWFEKLGLRRKKAILMYPAGMDFIVSFYGCCLAGVTAIPIYLPDTGSEIKRLLAIIEDSNPGHILIDSNTYNRFKNLKDEFTQLRHIQWIKTDTLVSARTAGDIPLSVSKDDTALIQYTSGSTSAPKGVEVTHGNLVHNLVSLGSYLSVSDKDKMVIWIPHYHDMGLILGIMFPMYYGISDILFSPFDFIRNPFCWLETISKTSATMSLAPNFAYDLCTRKVSDAQIKSLDLTAWSVAFNAAEPVRHDTISGFSKKFEQCGFREEAFYPAYGLAEATLIVSGGKREIRPVVKKVRISRKSGGVSTALPPVPDDASSVIGCGKSIGDNVLAIVDPVSSKRLKEDEIGEIWFKSPSVAKGYHGVPGVKNDEFNGYLSCSGHGPFLKTGDLGFLSNGELFVTGRMKDVIILRGKNQYPNDIEFTIDKSHPACRDGCCAVFSIAHDKEPQVIAVVEIRQAFYDSDRTQICNHIRKAVSRDHGITLDDVVLLKQRTIAKTSSGKIRRQQNRLDYSEGVLQNL